MLFRVLLLLILSVWLCLLTNNGFSAPRKPQKSLYENTSGIHVLNFKDIQKVLYRQFRSKHYVLQIYNSYCGHCINFAPHFRKLVASVTKWQHTLKFAVIDTVPHANSAVFALYNVKAVPSLLFIPSNATWSSKHRYSDIFTVEDFNITSMHLTLLNFLRGRVPELMPLSPSLTQHYYPILEKDSDTDAFLLVTNSDSAGLVAQTVIMDLLPIAGSCKLSWLTQSVEDSKSKQKSGVIVKKFNPLLNSSKLLNLRPISDVFSLESLILSHTGDRKAVQELVSHWSAELENHANQLQATVQSQREPPLAVSTDTVHLKDIESAIYRGLLSDVIIAGPHKHWSTVIVFVRLLSFYLVPALPDLLPLRLSLTNLNQLISEESPLTTDEWINVLHRSGFPDTPPDSWVSCKGSKPFLRGYPCGLWLLFHSLTVLRFLDTRSDSKPVIPVMRNFIVNVFSCPHCAENFASESARFKNGLEVSARAEVLWLWHTHNRVNERLRRQASEDPNHPKIKYPSELHCRDCASNEEALLQYLTKKHRVTSWEGLKSHEGLVINGSSKLFDLGFSFLDVGLCFFYFVATIVILLAVYCKLSKGKCCKKISFKKLRPHLNA